MRDVLLKVYLTPQAYDALTDLALLQYRSAADQVAWLVLQAVGLAQASDGARPATRHPDLEVK